MFDQVHYHLTETIAALRAATAEAENVEHLSALTAAAGLLADAHVLLHQCHPLGNWTPEGPSTRGGFHDAARRLETFGGGGSDAVL
jgi:hypothetical protein